jgi:hypothetical protein
MPKKEWELEAILDNRLVKGWAKYFVELKVSGWNTTNGSRSRTNC